MCCCIKVVFYHSIENNREKLLLSKHMLVGAAENDLCAIKPGVSTKPRRLGLFLDFQDLRKYRSFFARDFGAAIHGWLKCSSYIQRLWGWYSFFGWTLASAQSFPNSPTKIPEVEVTSWICGQKQLLYVWRHSPLTIFPTHKINIHQLFQDNECI